MSSDTFEFGPLLVGKSRDKFVYMLQSLVLQQVVFYEIDDGLVIVWWADSAVVGVLDFG